MTDENKSIERSYFYDEFGNSLGSWGNVANHYLYTGQEYDGAVSGLYNLRARYYKPDIGRFISEDQLPPSIYVPYATNNYLYARNTPTTYADPTGYAICRVTAKYPVRTWTQTISQKHITEWELVNALAMPEISGNQYADPLIFVIYCIWYNFENVTETLRNVIEYSYVIKCWPECRPPYKRSYDVTEYGPTYSKNSRKLKKTVIKPLYERLHTTVFEPTNRDYLKEWCKMAGPPAR